MRTTYPLAIIATLFCFACNKSNTANPPGNIEGTVLLYDDDGVKYPYDIGTRIILSSASFTDSTTTFQGGKYIFEKVPDGKYTLTASRNGFGSFKKFGIRHFSSDSSGIPQRLDTVKLAMIAGTTPLYYSVTASDSTDMFQAFYLKLTISPTPSIAKPRMVAFFMSADSSVSHQHFEISINNWSISHTNTQLGLSRTMLSQAGYVKGQKLYIRLYGNSTVKSEYFDSTLNRIVSPCLNMNTQPTVSFIMP